MRKALFLKAGACLFLTCFIHSNINSVKAAEAAEITENSLAGITVVMNEYYHEKLSESGISIENVATPIMVEGVKLTAVNGNIHQNLAVANVNEYVNVREAMDEEAEAVGKLYANGVAIVVEKGEEWTKVRSGSVAGYIKNEYLLFGEEAQKIIDSTYEHYAVATCTTLNVRSAATTESSIIAQVPIGEELEIVEIMDEWVQISYEGNKEAYVSKNYVDIQYAYQYAVSKEEEARMEEQKKKAAIAEANSYNINNMVWPLPSDHNIYSYYGKRVAPTAGASTFHKGLDIGGASGSSIVTVLSGTVTVASYSSSRGYYVEVNHGNGVVTRYQHCSKILVSVGQKVSQGDAIALVGSTGISTSAHLHFSLLINGENVDPYPYLKAVH